MQIEFMNESFAVVSVDSIGRSIFDARKAVMSLLKVKSWHDLIGFIEEHAVNKEIAWCSSHYFEIQFDGSGTRTVSTTIGEGQDWMFNGAPEYDFSQFGKSLSCVLENQYMPDYLDLRFAGELDAYRIINIKELVHVRDSLRGLVRMAAVALGAQLPIGLVSFEDCSNGLTLLEIDSSQTGFVRNGMFTEQVLFEETMYLPITPNSPLCMIEANTLRFDDAEITRCDAARISCGHIAAVAMNSVFSSLDFGTLRYPSRNSNEKKGYEFELEKGFFRENASQDSAWFESFVDEAIFAIEHDRVFICANCGTPFISERRGAKTCSASCRTELCNKRKLGTNPAR